MSTIIHPDDQQAIEKQHSSFESAYLRGLNEGQALRDELLEVLQGCAFLIERILKDEQWGAIEEYLEDAHIAIAKAKGNVQ